MRFTSLHISDFRGTRELEIHFEPDLTVIVGRNGAGKTSILDALAIAIGLARAQWMDFLEPALPPPPPPPAATIARSQSSEPGRSRFDFLHSVQEVREGASRARLEVGYEVRDHQTGESWTPVVAFGIDRGGSLADSVFVEDVEIFERLVSSQPRFVYYHQERGFGSGRDRPAGSLADVFDPKVVQDCSFEMDMRAIGDLSTWWDQRDAQEARRVRDGESGYRDPQLEAIRALIAKIDSFSGVKFDATASPPGLYFVKNDGTPVHVSGLSGGERSYIILLADLARRLQVFAPDKPLSEIPAIVLIDEVELNLHPGWQSEIVPTLAKVFRGCQFIVTTPSPQVLSGVESGKVRVIEEDGADGSRKVTVPLSTRGRTSNYLLEGVLGARERLPEIDKLIDAFNAAVDREASEAAVEVLESIERQIGDDAPTLLVLHKRLKKLRDGI